MELFSKFNQTQQKAFFDKGQINGQASFNEKNVLKNHWLTEISKYLHKLP